MTLAQLRYFTTAARYHSISKAAQMLFVTQPTISIAIRDLENEFSVTLFSHKNHHISLTEEGEQFYTKATAILTACEELKVEYSGVGDIKSHLRVGIPPMLSTIFFPELILRFHEAHPEVWVELQEYGSVRASEMVTDEVVDVGLVNMEIHNLDQFHSLQLSKEKLVYGVCNNHKFAKRKKLSLEELDKEPIIMYNQDSIQNRILQSRFDAISISPQIILRSSQIVTILKFLRQGKCGCFFYESMLKEMPEVKGIQLMPTMESRVGIIWKRGKARGYGVESFIDFMRQYK